MYANKKMIHFFNKNEFHINVYVKLLIMKDCFFKEINSKKFKIKNKFINRTSLFFR